MHRSVYPKRFIKYTKIMIVVRKDDDERSQI